MFDFLKRKEEAKSKYLHLAIDLDLKSLPQRSEENKASLEEGYSASFSKIKEIIRLQAKEKFPVLSFLLVSSELKENKELLLKSFHRFTEDPFFLDFLKENKIKLTLLGKWYSLPSFLLENLKKIVEETKDYDHFFLNFCLNYDGQEEIVDAFKIISRQIIAGKLDSDKITKELIKENIYSSYFIPPDLIIGSQHRQLNSFFLWDSADAKILFAGNYFPDFDLKWLEKVLKED